MCTLSLIKSLTSLPVVYLTRCQHYQERAALIAHRGKVVTITLKGYIFFGSAVKILQDVKSHVSIQVPDLSPQQLMQLQQQQAAVAEKQALANLSEATESTALLLPAHSQPAGSASAVKVATYNSAEKAADFNRLEGSRMSFRLTSSSGSGGKGQRPNNANSNSSSAENRNIPSLASSSGSAAKKLFPDISAPQASSKSSGASTYDTEFGALGRSSSMPIRTGAESSFTKPSRGQSFQQVLSVYDMSPDTMQRMIEERHRHDHSEQDTFGGGTSTAREHSTGCNNSSSIALIKDTGAGSRGGVSAQPKRAVAPKFAAQRPAAAAAGAGRVHAPAHDDQAGGEGGGPLGLADSAGDLEMGKVGAVYIASHTLHSLLRFSYVICCLLCLLCVYVTVFCR